MAMVPLPRSSSSDAGAVSVTPVSTTLKQGIAGISQVSSHIFSRSLSTAKPVQGPAFLACLVNPAHGSGLPRDLSTSSVCWKKSAKNAHVADTLDANSSADPFDFSALHDSISNVHARLREDLSKLRGGGKLNPEVLENLKVRLDKGATVERLSTVAQVVPRGRTMQIIASDKEHLKPISSAIASSSLSLTPQPDSQNHLQLNVNLPPPTTEARQQAVSAAQKLADVANDAVRNARGTHQKVLRAMERAKSARPDDVKKAGDQMEKVVAAGNAEVKKIADSAKKALAGS